MVQYAHGITMDDKIDCPLWWHKAGLQQTATSYGKKLTTRYKIRYHGRLYRIYAYGFSNAASRYILVRGRTLILR